MHELPLGTATQFNYVTFDIERSMRHWVTTMRAGPFFTWELPDPDLVPTRTYRGKPARDTFKACYGFIGSSMIELMQPTNNEPSPLREVLDTKGEVVQHIFPKIHPLAPGEYEEISAGYLKAGCEIASEAMAPVFGRNTFFDALNTIGAFIELVELNAQSYKIIELMYDAHMSWDGTRPIRPFTEVMEQVTRTLAPQRATEIGIYRGGR